MQQRDGYEWRLVCVTIHYHLGHQAQEPFNGIRLLQVLHGDHEYLISMARLLRNLEDEKQGHPE